VPSRGEAETMWERSDDSP